MAVTVYCTATDVGYIWSTFGITVREDDDFDGAADTGISAAMIEKATVDVNRCLLGRYTVAVCAASAWVKWATTIMACCDIARRRGMPVPEPLEAECQRYRDILERIRLGEEDLTTDTGVAPPALDNLPFVSNLTPDLRYKRAKIRRVPTTSTGGNQTSGRQQHVQDEYLPYG